MSLFTEQNATQEFRLPLSEAIALEAEDFERAMVISNPAVGEEKQWQTYLNALALLGLERWFNERLTFKKIEQNLDSSREEIGNFRLGKFQIGIITVEQVLDEVVSFPKRLLVEPESPLNFYAIAEVIEEEEEIFLRGAISHEKLVNLAQNYRDFTSNLNLMIPLDEFDLEPDHLLFYCRFLQQELLGETPAICGENVAAEADKNPAQVGERLAEISRWFQGIFESAWQPLEALVSPELSLAFNTRCVSEEIQRGKLINLGMQLNSRRFLMLVTVTPEADEKRRVLVQLHPTVHDEYLPPAVQLTLLSSGGKIYQEVTSRSCDNYIQLNPFKGKPGKKFSIEVSWNDTRITEQFEL